MVPVDKEVGCSFTSGFAGGMITSSQENLGYILNFTISSSVILPWYNISYDSDNPLRTQS